MAGNDGKLEEIVPKLDALLAVLAAQTEALQMIASYLAPDEPLYRRPLKDYWAFDWTSIGAIVTAIDNYGVSIVLWNGHLFNRRNASGDKYKEAVWFSRGIKPKKGEETQYKELVRFRDLQTAPEPMVVKPPDVQNFSGPDEAIKWAVDIQRFPTIEASTKAYQDLKEKLQPKTAHAMWGAWSKLLKEAK